MPPDGQHGADAAPGPPAVPAAPPCCCSELTVYLDRIEVTTKTKSLFFISATDDEIAVTAAATSSSMPGVQTAKWPDGQASWGLNDSDNKKKENISHPLAKFVTGRQECHIDLDVIVYIWRINFGADLKRALEDAANAVAPPVPGVPHTTITGVIDAFIESFFNILGLGRKQMDEIRLHFNSKFLCSKSVGQLLVGGNPSLRDDGPDRCFVTSTTTKAGGNWTWGLRIEKKCP